ncbi:MAG: hypothetical protein LBJ75_03685 [Puniceicoccales bacterium]|nr:hypothetical protein [Puniceicoccales bacterium]
MTKTVDLNALRAMVQNETSENSDIRVASLKVDKFTRQMHGGKTGSQQLKSRSAAATNPQRPATLAAPAADTSATDSIATELKALAGEIEKGEGKINIITKILTFIKSGFSRDAYDAAIARQAFREIDTNTQQVLVGLAFQAVALPENLGEITTNVPALLNFFQTVGVTANQIIEGINTIPGAGGRIRVLNELRLNQNFQWNNLSSEGANQVARDLVDAGKDGAGCLRTLLDNGKLKSNNLPTLDADAATRVARDLAGAGKDGVKCLNLLLENGKLKPDNLPAFDADAATRVAQDLAGAGEDGVKCLNSLLENGKLDILSLDDDAAKDFALDLVNGGEGGAECLDLLLKHDKLPMPHLQNLDVNAAKDFALKLFRVKPGGAKCLDLFLKNNKLPSLQNLDAIAARDFVVELARVESDNTLCLSKFVYYGTLDNLKNLDVNAAKDFVLKLVEVGGNGVNCLRLLRDKVPDFDAPTAKKLVLALAEALAEAEENEVECLEILMDSGKLNSLQNLNDDAARDLARDLTSIEIKVLSSLERFRQLEF